MYVLNMTPTFDETASAFQWSEDGKLADGMSCMVMGLTLRALLGVEQSRTLAHRFAKEEVLQCAYGCLGGGSRWFTKQKWVSFIRSSICAYRYGMYILHLYVRRRARHIDFGHQAEFTCDM